MIHTPANLRQVHWPRQASASKKPSFLRWVYGQPVESGPQTIQLFTCLVAWLPPGFRCLIVGSPTAGIVAVVISQTLRNSARTSDCTQAFRVSHTRPGVEYVLVLVLYTTTSSRYFYCLVVVLCYLVYSAATEPRTVIEVNAAR